MSSELNEYRRLEQLLIRMRWLHRGHETPAEEALLEQMADAWKHLDVSEREMVRGESPKSLIASTDENRIHHRLYEPLDTSGRHRVLRDVA